MEKEELEKYIEETFNSISGIQRANADPLLYEKIMERKKKTVRNFQLVKAVSFIIFIIVGLSVFFWRIYFGSEDGKRKQGVVSSTYPISSSHENGSCYISMFNKMSVVDIEGIVDNILQNQDFPPVLRVDLKTKNKKIPVLLSPDWYLEQKHFQINVGDSIIVRGSKINYKGKEILTACAITNKKNKNTLPIRDEEGMLIWVKEGFSACY